MKTINFRRLFFIYTAMLLTIWGCKKDPIISLFDTKVEGYILVNEGQFGKSNGSISFIDVNGASIVNDIYYIQNGGLLGGDVFQSIQFNDGKAFLVINNSNKIVIVDSTTFEFIEEYTGISSPREILFSDTKSFITQLFSSSLAVYENSTLLESIDLDGDLEKMLISNNTLFVPVKIPYAGTSTTKGLQAISLSDYTDITLIPTINGAESLAKDGFGNIWMLCNGGFSYDTDNPKTAARIYKINPTTLEKTDSLSFEETNFAPTDLKNAIGGTNIYFREGGTVYKLNTTSAPISFEEMLNASTTNANGYIVDETKNQIIVTDAVDYSSQGDVLIYNLDTKTLKNTLKSDVGPSKIYPRY